jgi:hypothetical protein
MDSASILVWGGTIKGGSKEVKISLLPPRKGASKLLMI